MVDFDIICAGFPCQAFSNGGKKKCFEDERGLLFDEIIRIAKEKRPRFAVQRRKPRHSNINCRILRGALM